MSALDPPPFEGRPRCESVSDQGLRCALDAGHLDEGEPHHALGPHIPGVQGYELRYPKPQAVEVPATDYATSIPNDSRVRGTTWNEFFSELQAENERLKQQLAANTSETGLQLREKLDEELQQIDDAIEALGGPRDNALAFLRALTQKREAWLSDPPNECPMHGIHGAEAEQLRAGIEKIISENFCDKFVHAELQQLLDRVDARDSLAYLERNKARTLDEWHDDIGHVLWWRFPIDEPPFVGDPRSSDWPGYHTHWTPLPPCPEAP